MTEQTLEEVQAEMVDGAVDPVEVPVETAKKLGGLAGLPSGPLSILALIFALAGGGAGGLSFLQNNNDDGVTEADVTRIVGLAETRLLKRQQDDLAQHRTADAQLFASNADVSALSAKMDMVLRRMDQIYREVSDGRRGRRPPP